MEVHRLELGPIQKGAKEPKEGAQQFRWTLAILWQLMMVAMQTRKPGLPDTVGRPGVGNGKPSIYETILAVASCPQLCFTFLSLPLWEEVKRNFVPCDKIHIGGPE